ncbi:hypothetical protein Acr_00g0057140 [Actinidia rufa]|uniref:Uncharacterized protein n=1 Tax=Actinidia rufa TaxID=165716 RepID=A0A7J0DMF6_9ERIC|nr:hypothetical protein Acr_00g0057140 [Actinidia rufa]
MSIDPVEHEYDMWEQHNMHNVPLEDPEDHITQFEQSNPNGGKAGEEKQPRRLWTSKEEEALLVAMLDCLGDKWKGHNGFKPRFFNVTHKGVSGMNRKTFPMFEDWQTLFGHDKATGEITENAPEVPDGTPIQTPDLDDTWNDCYSPRYTGGEPLFPDGIFVDITGNDPIDNINPSTPRGNVNPSSTPKGNINPSNPRGDGNPSTPITNIPVPERPKKKAKLDALNEMMKGFIAQNNAHMKKLTNALGYDKELSNKRKSAFSELIKLDMDEMDRFKVNNIIVVGEERLDAFFVIPYHMKQHWVEGVLDGKVTF